MSMDRCIFMFLLLQGQNEGLESLGLWGLQVGAVFVGLYVTCSHKSVSTCLRSSCGIQTCGCVWSAVVNVDFPSMGLANLRCSKATLNVLGNRPL